jgi:hypothetical protein
MTRQWRSGVHRRLAGVGWGLGLTWIGLALLLELDLGPALLGLGIVTLGVQGLRRLYGLSFEIFWVAIGAAFLMGGLGGALGIEIGLLPLVLLAFGATLLLAALTGHGGAAGWCCRWWR